MTSGFGPYCLDLGVRLKFKLVARENPYSTRVASNSLQSHAPVKGVSL